jgi:hypothetical protein
MNNYQSIATINGPEFINLQPLEINPMLSECDIKVLYLGKNRNGTSIDKDSATRMAKTLRGAPIVGYYKQEEGDFRDHGEQIVQDGDGLHFNILTKPFGFVAPNAPVWFQDFQDMDEESNSYVIRTYLMTKGYLWTGQFEEAQQVLDDGGKPQSMELDAKTLSGFWTKDSNTDYEFFIINDAVFSKLCILGDDVEPCFEGASITAPNVSRNFTLNNEFKQTLFGMMQELQYALQKGGSHKVEDELKNVEVDSSLVESTDSTPEEVTSAADALFTSTEEHQDTLESVDSSEVITEEAVSDPIEDADSIEYAAKEDKEESDSKDKEETSEEDDSKEDDEDVHKKFTLLQAQFTQLQADFEALQEEAHKTAEQLAEAKKYILQIEDEKKDDVIAEFYMLSDEDKQDVIEHKSEYSLDQIKSKLAVICFDKKVNYTNLNDNSITVTVDSQVAEKPAWVAAIDSCIGQ